MRLDYSNHNLKVVLEDRRFKMEMETQHSDAGVLKAPKNGLMNREILESITAVVKVKLSHKKGDIIYEGKGTHTGLEIVEDIFKYYDL